MAMKAWTAALSDETDIKDESEKLEYDAEMFEDMEVIMDAFVTPRHVIAMIANETK